MEHAGCSGGEEGGGEEDGDDDGDDADDNDPLRFLVPIFSTACLCDRLTPSSSK